MEEWRQVPSLPFVWASSLGRVRIGPYEQAMPHGGTKTVVGEARVGDWDGDRYHVVVRRRTYKVARLVCEAFHGPAPAGERYCLHRDENARNNRPGNLKWGTQKENLNAPGYLARRRGEVF
jgi:hypothetical protein